MNATNGAPAEVRPKGWVLTLIREAAAADRLYPTDQMLAWARGLHSIGHAPAPVRLREVRRAG